MAEITKIELMMTIAFVFYTLAIYLGRNQKKWGLPRWVHFSAGGTGFFLDMWATWDMEQLRATGWTGFEGSYLLLGHTIVSTLAIALFLLMVTLGYKRKIKAHRKVVLFAFAPVWFISYTSGLVMVSINDDRLMSAFTSDHTMQRQLSNPYSNRGVITGKKRKTDVQKQPGQQNG